MALDPFPGLTGLPVSLHPYLYAFDNPLRYTDPSGQIPPLLIALAAGALIGGGISYGSQVFQNYQNGLSGPDAWFRCIEWWDVGLGAAEGSLFAGLGFLTGGLIWDMAVRGHAPSEALLGNVLAFGFGEIIGFGVSRLGRGLFRGGIGLGAAGSRMNQGRYALQRFYPPNRGFLGETSRQFLHAGEIIDRFGGSPASRFFSPQGTPAGARALPPSTSQQPLRTFEVMKPFEVEAGTVAPWFGKLGLGTQYGTPVTLDVLLSRGVLREITP